MTTPREAPGGIATMSGSAGNHVPDMVEHFREERTSLPTFSGNGMADLIAPLHSGEGPGAGSERRP